MAVPVGYVQINRQNLFQPSPLPTHDEINLRLQQAVLAPSFSALPSINLLKYAAGVFNLYSAPTSHFQPSIAVRVKLLELAGATKENAPRMLNFNQLNPIDLACIFRILNSYSSYEVGTNPYAAVFPSIVPSLQQYLIYLCIDDRGAQILETLRSYQDPALAVIIQQMIASLASRVRPPEHHIEVERPYVRPPLEQVAVQQRREQERVHQEPPVIEDDLVHQLLARNDRLQEENEGLRQHFEDADQQIFQLTEENEGLLRRLRAMEAVQPQFALQGQYPGPQDVADLERRLLIAEQDKDYEASINAQVRADADRALDRLRREYEQAISDLAAEKNKAEREKEVVEGDLERMTRDLTQLKTRHEELTRREEGYRRTAERIPELERQLQGLQVGVPAEAQGAPKNDASIRELRDKNQQQTIKIAELERQVQTLQTQLRAAKAAGQVASSDNAKLKAEIREISEKLNKALEEIAQLKAK